MAGCEFGNQSGTEKRSLVCLVVRPTSLFAACLMASVWVGVALGGAVALFAGAGGATGYAQMGKVKTVAEACPVCTCALVAMPIKVSEMRSTDMRVEMPGAFLNRLTLV